MTDASPPTPVKVSFWERFFYDSPLSRASGKILLAVILASCAAPAVLMWNNWLTNIGGAWRLPIGILIALVGSLPSILFLRWLDRRDPEPLIFYVAVVVLCAALFAPVAGLLNGLNPYSTLTVGLNEEFFKILPVLLFVFFAPTLITGVRDGIIYGALSGMGFNLLEYAIYSLRADAGFAGFYQHLSRIGIFGIDNHVVWSALVGAGIGLAIQTENKRLTWAAPLVAFLLAAVTHTAQDLLIGAMIAAGIVILILRLKGYDTAAVDALPETEAAELTKPYFWPSSVLEIVVINIINLIILGVALARSGNWERRVVADGLAGEDQSVVTPEELAGANAEKRYSLRKPTAGSKVRNAQNALAMHKEYLRRKGRDATTDRLAEALRTEVVALRPPVMLAAAVDER